jgi:hypothetical protein
MRPCLAILSRAVVRRVFAFFCPMLLVPQISAASPFSPAGLDSAIAACAASIDADSLQSYIEVLQGFSTRHTASDTVSTTVGIGAARRWMHDKFLEFGVSASYHDYTTEVSGITQEYRNVVGEIPGTVTGPDARIYVIGGHLDSRNDDVDDPVGFAPGADDNASGIACILECARVMSTKSWPMTVRFVGFTGEEQGLIGSEFYASFSKFTNEPIAAMIANDTMASVMGAANPDTVVMADTTKARIFALGPEDSPHRQLQRYLKAMGDVYVPIQDIVIIPAEDRPSRGSDHQSYTNHGFTAVRYMEYLEEIWRQHSVDGDTLGTHLSMSYLRRQAQVDVSTLANLSRAPASPEGLTVGDIGDSTGFRLTWPTTNGEPDLDGYLVTMRTPGALDYETVFDVGMVNEFVVNGPPADSMWFGLSIENTAGHRALVLNEVLGVLSSIPAAPLTLVATSSPGAIQLDWNPSSEGDLLGYNVYRSPTSGSGYTLLTGSPVATPSYSDASPAPQAYYYYVVTAVDSSLNESGFSNEDYGRRATLDAGILFVDETKDGTSAWFPTDALANAAYAAQMGAISHDFWEVDVSGLPRLADLGMYSSVLWIADDYNTKFMGFDLVSQFLDLGIGDLEDYMALGGNVMLAGWAAAQGVAHPEEYPLDLEAGDFLYDHVGVDAITWKRNTGFTGGTGQGIFADVFLEPTRLRGSWGGKLTRCEYLTGVRPGSTVGYLFDSIDPDSVYHQQPCATYQDHGSHRTVYWGFPLYHLKDGEANAALTAALTYFGELGTTGVGDVAGISVPLSLGQNRPNPFRGATEIRFAVPGDETRIGLTVYDIAGRRVRRLVAGDLPGGRHSVTWDGRNDEGRGVATGIYFYRLEGPEETLTKKLVLLR